MDIYQRNEAVPKHGRSCTCYKSTRTKPGVLQLRCRPYTFVVPTYWQQSWSLCNTYIPCMYGGCWWAVSKQSDPFSSDSSCHASACRALLSSLITLRSISITTGVSNFLINTKGPTENSLSNRGTHGDTLRPWGAAPYCRDKRLH